MSVAKKGEESGMVYYGLPFFVVIKMIVMNNAGKKSKIPCFNTADFGTSLAGESVETISMVT